MKWLGSSALGHLYKKSDLWKNVPSGSQLILRANQGKKGGRLKVWVGRAYEGFERFGWGPGWGGYVRQIWNSSCLAIAWTVLRLWGFLCVLSLTQLRLSYWPPHFCIVFPSCCLARPKAGWEPSLGSSSGSPRGLVKKWETGGNEVTGDSSKGT